MWMSLDFTGSWFVVPTPVYLFDFIFLSITHTSTHTSYIINTHLMFVLVILNAAKRNPPMRPNNQVLLEMVRNRTQLTTSRLEMLLASQHSQKNSGKEIDKASKRIKTISASKAHKDDTYLEPLLPQRIFRPHLLS
jgi:hypothetical protein